jgi:hypothetical protein
MNRLAEMFDRAQQRLAAGEFDDEDLQQLRQAALQPTLRQRLLYLYALQPTVRAMLVATTVQDAHAGTLCQIDPMAPELPYRCVMDAIAEGWRVIHFPDHRAPYQEGRIDMLGYEFILEKLEAYAV